MSEFDPKKELEKWNNHCEKAGLEFEGAATPAKELEERLLNPNVAKSELEHYAARLVTTLKAELLKREWISVEENPEIPNKMYLVFDDRCLIGQAFYHKEQGWMEAWGVKPIKISRWMGLPPL